MTQPKYNQDAHVRAYYDQPVTGIIGGSNAVFCGERRAVVAAYLLQDGGYEHDAPFTLSGSTYKRIVFPQCPFIVCFRIDRANYVTEVQPRDYETIWAHSVEMAEQKEYY